MHDIGLNGRHTQGSAGMAARRIPELQTVAEAADQAVPTARTVRSLDDALRLVARLGGSIASETRAAPGIGSWALVTDRDGNDLVLWENAALA
jgi:predicted enzyme related to lactoylglutathione lyase